MSNKIDIFAWGCYTDRYNAHKVMTYLTLLGVEVAIVRLTKVCTNLSSISQIDVTVSQFTVTSSQIVVTISHITLSHK